ncbi:hypothetical protein C4588_01035 [Candidatus Parcubacteria bacterium]|nr:MAG: hypothetical protein C4588_01035 [Candidatus Parcubacteria bacterium]
MIVYPRTDTVVRVAIPDTVKMMKVFLEEFPGNPVVQRWRVQYTHPPDEGLKGLTFEMTTLDKYVEDGWAIIYCAE